MPNVNIGNTRSSKETRRDEPAYIVVHSSVHAPLAVPGHGQRRESDDGRVAVRAGLALADVARAREAVHDRQSGSP